MPHVLKSSKTLRKVVAVGSPFGVASARAGWFCGVARASPRSTDATGREGVKALKESVSSREARLRFHDL